MVQPEPVAHDLAREGVVLASVLQQLYRDVCSLEFGNPQPDVGKFFDSNRISKQGLQPTHCRIQVGDDNADMVDVRSAHALAPRSAAVFFASTTSVRGSIHTPYCSRAAATLTNSLFTSSSTSPGGRANGSP